MDDLELRRVDRGLRGLFEGTDLEWVLNEVDEAIADGVSEERILQRRRGKGRQRREGREDFRAAASEDYTIARAEGGEREASRRGGTLVITTRPMTLRERVLLLLDAVRRVVIELPEIEAETLAALRPATTDEGLRLIAETVVFEPEEGLQGRRSDRRTTLTERISRERREAASALFARVREEV
ncbi:hypothetical protein [Actinoallomurus acaciae]|uniref:DUF222 domain-containing protein n=1 Tax=Actinoallomurus acaciae TaxID=502577 RepID=A0ABV5YBT0_9ACTN